MRAANTAVLPRFLRPFQVPELARLGRDSDGGYLLDQRCIADADCLVSIGINDDWSFEKDFRSRSRAPLIAIDASTTRWLFFRRQSKYFLKGLVHRRNRNIFRHYKGLQRDYNEFFRNQNRHVRKYVAGSRDGKHMTIDDILQEFVPKHCHRLLLKIDIELGEYGILDDICAVSDRLSSLIIEFHDVYNRIDEIERFVAKLALNLCHVHCNNCCGIDGRGFPWAIELSFTAHKVGGACAAALPNELDRSNTPYHPEIQIVFE